MAPVDRARKHFAELLEADEDFVDAVQIMQPGSTKAYAAVAFTGVIGALGAMAFEHLGAKKGPSSDELDEELHVRIGEFNLGQLAFSDRRLYLLPPRASDVQPHIVALAGTTVSYNDSGVMSSRRRTFLVVAADGRWFVGEVQMGSWLKRRVEAFTKRLSSALDVAS